MAGTRRVLMLWLLTLLWTTAGFVKASPAKQPFESVPVMGKPTDSSDVSAVVSGPFETERTALLKKIHDAQYRGIGIKAYMGAFHSLECMVDSGSSAESIRVKLDRLEGALNEQFSVRDWQIEIPPPSASADTGIIGLKFRVHYPNCPEIATIFPGTPAETGQLKSKDTITHVNGIPTKGLSKGEIYQLIVGRPGTKLTIAIKRGDANFVKTLTRMNLQDLARGHPDIWRMYLVN